MKPPAKNGMEYDAISRWARRSLCCFQRPGFARRGKNSINRRFRRSERAVITEHLDGAEDWELPRHLR